VQAERAALAAPTDRLQFPFQWYSRRRCSSSGSTRCSLRLAYGPGGTALRGKDLCWRSAPVAVNKPTTRAAQPHFIDAFWPPIEQTAVLAACDSCPLVLHAAHGSATTRWPPTPRSMPTARGLPELAELAELEVDTSCFVRPRPTQD